MISFVAPLRVVMFVALFLAGSLLADDFLAVPDFNLDEDLPYKIDAPSMSLDKETGWAIGEGGVVITRGDQVLKADRVRVNINTGDVIGEGNITLLRKGEKPWTGDTIKYNFKTRVGIADDFDLSFGPVNVKAEKGERMKSGLYALDGASVTTCSNNHPRACWHYHATTRRLEVEPNVDLKAWGVTWYLGRVPFLYVPYWYRDLDGVYGLTVEPGYESRHGAMLENTYRWRMTENLRTRSHLDLRTKRGLGLGQDFTWELPELGTGRLRLYYLHDLENVEDVVDDPRLYRAYDSDRGRILLTHRLDTTQRDAIRVNAHWLTDYWLLEDFFEEEYRASRQPQNQVSWNHWHENLAYGVIARYRLNDDYDVVQRLPEMWLNVNRTELGASSIYYESQTEMAYLDKKWSEFQTLRATAVTNASGNVVRPTAPEDYSLFRADTWQQLVMPGKIGFVNFTPRAGARLTYFSDTAETVAQTTTLASGTVLTNSVQESTGGDFRVIGEVGARASFKAFRIWRDRTGARRHVVEPYADYLFRPEPNLTPDDLYAFDEIDNIDESHRLRLGVRNKLQRKIGDASWTTMDVDLYGDVLFSRDDEEEVLDTVGMRARFRPVRWMRIESDGEYSLSYSALEDLSMRLRLQHARMGAELEYRYLDPDLDEENVSSLARGSVTLRATDRWSYHYYGRYELDDTRLEEQGAYVQMALDCLTFRVTGRVQPGYNRDDGTHEDTDYGVSFNVWVNAFQQAGS